MKYCFISVTNLNLPENLSVSEIISFNFVVVSIFDKLRQCHVFLLFHVFPLDAVQITPNVVFIVQRMQF